jgi:hypothetical protein
MPALEMTRMTTESVPTIAEIMAAAAHCVRTDNVVEAVSQRNAPLTLCKAQFENAGAYVELVEILRRLLEASPHVASSPCSNCGFTGVALSRMLSSRNMTLVTFRDERERKGAGSVMCDFDRDSCIVYMEEARDGTARVMRVCAC